MLDSDYVTQYGEVGPSGFRNRPRAGAEPSVSVFAGQWSVREATVRLRRRPPERADAVRYATVGALKEAGFTVREAPTRRNPEHAVVEYRGSWDDEVAKRFEGCFGEPVSWGGREA